MSTHSPFKLSAQLIGHSKDVKAVEASSSPDIIFSSSRDNHVITWTRLSESDFTVASRFESHSHFVNSLCFIRPSDKHPNGLIVSGSSDKIINVFDPLSTTEPLYTLLGHDNNVCALDYRNGMIASASWDQTAKIWKDWTCINTLKGHSHAVWDVIFVDDEGSVLTASADKSIKLWSNGVLKQTYIGHTDAVRGLSLFSSNQFISCSNDCTIRIWNFSGDCTAQLVGHTSFVYSINVLNSGEIVSSAEDRSVRVWKGTECVQVITHPCNSVWSVVGMINGDIVSGGSDGVVRVFTRNSERFAPSDQLKTFDDEVAKFAIPVQQLGGIDKPKILGPEALLKPGRNDQHSIIVKVGDILEAYKWSEADQKWVKVGEVVNAPGSGSRTTFAGKEYDYVFDVDLGSGPPLKLPYNSNENPYAAAQEFIYRNELNQDFLDQIANFIITNTQGQTIGQDTYSNYSDPFTGGGRYVPQGSTSSQPTPQSYADPFTGGNRYVTQDNQPGLTPKPAGAGIPQANYTLFTTSNPSAILTKTLQLNQELLNSTEHATVALNEREQGLLKKINGLLGSSDFASSFGEDEYAVLLKIALQWPASHRFPGIDLMRLAVLYTTAPITESWGMLLDLIPEIALFNQSGKEQDICRMLGLRVLVNLFASEKGKNEIFRRKDEVFDMVKGIRGDNKNLKVAFITLLSNFAVALKDNKDSDFAINVLKQLADVLNREKDPETAKRGLVAVGTLIVTYGDEMKQVAKLVGISELLDSVNGVLGIKEVQSAISRLLM